MVSAMALSGSLSTVRTQVPPHSHFEKTFAYLDEALRPGSEANLRVLGVPVGESKRIELSDGIFALEQAYLTKAVLEGKWESHLKYIDVQVIVSGEENFGVCALGHLEVSEDLTPAKDVILYKPTTQGSVLRLHAGEAAILFPVDGHLPGIQVAEPLQVRKIVVKVPVF
jgi:YhcH/YjgK/YiaL family protein